MKRRSFLLSTIASSVSVLTLQAHAKSYLPPLYSLLFDNPTEPMTSSWLDSVGLLPVGHPALTVSDRSQKIFVDGDAVTQGNGTEASPYKDFYFLGGRSVSGSRVKSRIAINPANTVIYVRGTFRLSDHQQDVNGSSMRIQISNNQMSNGSGGHYLFSADKPLIFAPWPNQTGPIFDAEEGLYPESGASNGDDGPIHAFGGESLAAGYTDLEIRGFTVKNGECSALIRFHQGCRTARVISCHVFDGKPQSQSPAQSGGIMFEMSKVNANHLIDHCQVENNSGNVTNNIGEIGWLSNITLTNSLDNRLTIQNSIIRNSYRALTGKKSGNSTIIVRNNYIHNMAAQAIYARGGTMKFEYNLFKHTAGVCQPDYQFLKAPKHIIIDHNTVIDCGAVIITTNDQPELAKKESTSITITNNAFRDTGFNNIPLLFQALYDDNTTQVPDSIISANNRFGLPNADSVFLRREALLDLFFSVAMTTINDSGSLLTLPDIDSSYSPQKNGNCDHTGSNGTNIGAF